MTENQTDAVAYDLTDVCRHMVSAAALLNRFTRVQSLVKQQQDGQVTIEVKAATDTGYSGSVFKTVSADHDVVAATTCELLQQLAERECQ